jgi:phenylpropionate dioxygenase-like ring-hydroxylating dioxygenase large terminal subunit
VVENTLESYHVALIHSDSFKNLGAEGLNFSFSGDHSLWNAKLAINENDGKQEKVHKPYQNRNFKINGYDHFILFPNILLSTTYGVSFNLSHIVPIDNETTFFRSYVFMTKLDSDRIINPLENMYEYSLTKFNRQVFEEDKIICEEVQKGVRVSIFDGELSEEEMRVRHFQERYRFYLDKK